MFVIGGTKLRKITLAIVFITIFFLLIGCASGPKASKIGDDELNIAIREVSDYLNKRIQAGSKAVFLNVKSDWPGLSEYILDSLTENAVNDEVFTIVDRQQLDLIRAEQNFQYSGEVSDASAQEIGQMLGAQTIVSGLVTKVGSEYRIQVRAIAVQTAALQGLTTRNIDSKGPFVTALTAAPVPAPVAALQPNNEAVAYYNQGQAYYDIKNYNYAIKEYTQALRLNPDYWQAYLSRGVAYVTKKDYSRAIADYNQMLRLNPNFAGGYHVRGIAYYAKKDYDRAIADYNKALQIDPNYTDLYRSRGNAYFAKKKYDLAIDDYTQLLRFNSNNARAYYNRGFTYYIKDDYDRAIADFEAALRIDPNDANTKKWLEIARKERGR